MYLTVVTSSRSGAIGQGLTYEVDGQPGIKPGFAVKVPLRKKIVDGIVIEVLEKKLQTEFDLRAVKDVLGDSPLLTEAQMKTVRWMSEYYCCSLRQALQVWLPPPPWSRLLQTGPAAASDAAALAPTLTEQQQAVFQSIRTDPRPSLLFGITGSGKTEVYAALIANVIIEGKQAILLVPEILLTEHIIDRITRMLPRERIAILHSRLKPSERKNEWKRIHRGEVALVIGSRSALFAPLGKLGLIVIDEEHEWTYKNEQTPRYHARETAEELCRNAGAKLVLGSATPSLESWSRGKSAAYHVARLPERYGAAQLPQVSVVDLADVQFGKYYPFSPQMIAAIGERLKKDEQCVLFLNRRGAASALLCMQCRRRVVSPESQLPYTVHHAPSGEPYLMDHASGVRVPVPARCPHCSSTELRDVGAGTQGLELTLKKLFPRARLLRADSDTLEHPEQMRDLLVRMRERRADILLGTQSVVKGLDLPGVTLAGVLVADIGLSLPHFRAGERTFQLLTQLAGRSGRAAPGEVIIQTFRPHAPEIERAAAHQTEKYLEEELRMREHAGYPPALSMIRLILRGPDAGSRAKTLQGELHAKALRIGSDAKISVAPTLFGAGRQWHVLLRGTGLRALLSGMGLSGIVIDVDPVETL